MRRSCATCPACDTQTALEMKPAPALAAATSNLKMRSPSPEFSLACAWPNRAPAISTRRARSKTDGQDRPDLLSQGYEKLAENLKIEVPVLVRGVLRAEEDAAPKLAVSSITALEDVKVKLPRNLRIRVAMERATEGTLTQLHALIVATPGTGKLLLDLEQKGEFLVVLEPTGFAVAADKAFVERVEELVGLGSVRVIE